MRNSNRKDMRDMEYVITGNDIRKEFKGFVLDIPQLLIPQGLATALIGENGAGKTTLMNILSGIRLDYQGQIQYFAQKAGIDDTGIRDRIGYTGPGSYYLPHWTVKQVEDANRLLFKRFQPDTYKNLCRELAIPMDAGKEARNLSDGNRMKLMLAAVLSRNTELLILDEPASPLDPLMRDKLCDLIREYLVSREGERSVFFSTHNVADMENVTDYAIIMEQGRIVEQGFVEDLKEKYVSVKGNAEYADKVSSILVTQTRSRYGFEGICLAEKLDRLAGMNVVVETPTLSQICVAVMKAHSQLQF
ncbi:MAG: ABC transporter ATP-binding protein [Acetatifactor sp.]|nr:ABC transporter ATP-binding protein [Acetatifactor sp.]